MHQRLERAPHEPVVDEDLLFDRQLGVAAFQIAHPIATHPMTKRQILRPRGGANRIGLDESQAGDGVGERGRLEQAADGEPSQLSQGRDDPSVAWRQIDAVLRVDSALK